MWFAQDGNLVPVPNLKPVSAKLAELFDGLIILPCGFRVWGLGGMCRSNESKVMSDCRRTRMEGTLPTLISCVLWPNVLLLLGFGVVRLLGI